MIFRREPVAIVNAVRLAVLAAMTFGLSLTDAQLIATMAALEAALTLLARQQVTPNETVEDEIDMVHRLAGLPPRDDVPTTGAPRLRGDDGKITPAARFQQIEDRVAAMLSRKDAGQVNVSGIVWTVVGLLLIVALAKWLGWI